MFGRRATKKPMSVPRDAWYRSSEWDERARAEFTMRLARAKPANRVQYRRIKAIALLRSGERRKQAAGREMLEQNLAERDARGDEKVLTFSLLAAHEQESGQLDDAERHLRAALQLMSRNRSGSTQLEEIRLAEILLVRGGRPQLEAARDLLDRLAASPPLLLSSRFRWCVVGAKVSLALEDKARAAEWASSALELADATHSGLAYHPDLGLVETDATTRAWLAGVAGSSAHSWGR